MIDIYVINDDLLYFCGFFILPLRECLLFIVNDSYRFIPDHSSAGRAEDCSVARLSLGRWFDSGWSEFFIIINFFLNYNLIPILYLPTLEKVRMGVKKNCLRIIVKI